jgi:FkbM family methyltransferase
MIDPYNNYVKDDFIKYIDKSHVKTIFEIGARECGYTQEIIDCYTSCEELHIFECNPYTLNLCKENVNNLNRNKSNLKKIKFNSVGVSDKSEILDFYAVQVGDDFGSSSAGFFPTEKAHSLVNSNHKVNCITIDDYCVQENINSIDMILIDIEGGELKAFKGAKNMLSTVQYIIVETQDVQRYADTPLREDIAEYLKEFGLKEVYTTCNGYFGDSVFAR